MQTLILMWLFFRRCHSSHLCYFVMVSEPVEKASGIHHHDIHLLRRWTHKNATLFLSFISLLLLQPFLSPNRQNVAENNNNKYQIIPRFGIIWWIRIDNNRVMSNNDFSRLFYHRVPHFIAFIELVCHLIKETIQPNRHQFVFNWFTKGNVRAYCMLVFHLNGIFVKKPIFCLFKSFFSFFLFVFFLKIYKFEILTLL